MCKWAAINGVVILAIKSGKYADDEIAAALLRLAASGHSVTVDSLRIEIEGLPASRPGRQQQTDDLFTRNLQRDAGRSTPMGELT
jgi:hypothetical protein